jgi:ribulose-5-phosphate 4-epimerase/fuculose-1-phosphate aldolase
MGDVMRKCYEKDWLTSRDGNISMRKCVDGIVSKNMHITPAGVRKYNIHPEDIIKVDMTADSGDMDIDGVSTEFWMHYHLQKDAKYSRVVLHVHPTHVVAAMFAGWDLQKLAKKFPEISRYTKVGPTVGFFEAGSHGLANFTNLAFRGGNFDYKIQYDIVGQANHGVCVVGKNPWDCYEHIERLNHICEIVLASGVKPDSENK